VGCSANQLFSRYEYRDANRLGLHLTDMARWNLLPVPPKVTVGLEWAVRGSNPRPPRCKRGALTG
jgi:hypothetical protein